MRQSSDADRNSFPDPFSSVPDPEALVSLHMEQFRVSLLVARLRAARVHYSYGQAALLFQFDSAEQAAWCFGVLSEGAP
jgi:hypothetical protein